MNILFFDVETNGLPKNWEGSPGDLNNWPRVVQIAYILSDDSGFIIDEGQAVIKPEGWTIPPEASSIHGVTTERAIEIGKPLQDVLVHFNSLVDSASIICAHNLKFDKPVVWAELQRSRVPSWIFFKKGICTMLSTIEFCALPGKGALLKWPKLQELHIKLFGEEFSGAHDALADIQATHRCFFELMRIQDEGQYSRFFDLTPKPLPVFTIANK